MLTNYNGTTINYEPTGNPINWRNSPVMEWNGRQLSLFAHPDGAVTCYTYNADGIRTKKTYYDAGGTTEKSTQYILDGTKIVAEKTGNQWTYYLYDENGAPAGIIYDGELYGYRKNLRAILWR